LVLELLEGSTLADHLTAHQRLTVEDTVRFLVPVFEALEELHRAGVVHRDLKPANVFLARTPKGGIMPKLLDFGVAKVLDDQGGLHTTTGIVVGTPAYMSPEQAAGTGHVGPWTDIWAAGCVLHECLAGVLPFSAPTPSLMLVEVMTKPAPPLRDKCPELPAAVCAVVDRALAKDPEDRFVSVAALADALCKAAGMEPPSHIVAAAVRLPVAFADTQHAMPTPLPPRGSSSGAVVVEPPATGPSSTGRTRLPRARRAMLGAALGVALLGLGAAPVWWLRAHPSELPHEDTRPAQPALPSTSAPLSANPAATAEPSAPQAELPASPPGAQAPGQAAVQATQELPTGADLPADEPKKPPATARRRAKERERRRPRALTPLSQPAPAPQPVIAAPSEDPHAPSVEREW
jgi:serine/threonine-protein kinase